MEKINCLRKIKMIFLLLLLITAISFLFVIIATATKYGILVLFGIIFLFIIFESVKDIK